MLDQHLLAKVHEGTQQCWVHGQVHGCDWLVLAFAGPCPFVTASEGEHPCGQLLAYVLSERHEQLDDDAAQGYGQQQVSGVHVQRLLARMLMVLEERQELTLEG